MQFPLMNPVAMLLFCCYKNVSLYRCYFHVFLLSSQAVVTMTSKGNGERGILTLVDLKPLKIYYKNWTFLLHLEVQHARQIFIVRPTIA